MRHSMSIVQVIVTLPTPIFLIVGQNIIKGLKSRFRNFKHHIYLSLGVMALIKMYKFSATAKHLILKCLPIHNERSSNLTHLVTKTLLNIDSKNLVARSIDVPKFSAECP